jgi:hypothetical protein
MGYKPFDNYRRSPVCFNKYNLFYLSNWVKLEVDTKCTFRSRGNRSRTAWEPGSTVWEPLANKLYHFNYRSHIATLMDVILLL